MENRLKYKRCHKLLHGFTLIELLVVISIIALLLSILIPSLNRAKEQAKGVVCSARLKQLGLAWQMYCIDNDEYIPLEDYTSGSNIFGVMWTDHLNKYLETSTIYDKDEGGRGTNAILWCPSVKKTGPMMEIYTDYWGWTTTYMANNFAGVYYETPGSTTRKIARRRTKHRRPSVTMIFCDGVWRQSYLTLLLYGVSGEDMLTGTDYYCRHNGRMNAVFMDGSVGSFEKKLMWDTDRITSIQLPWYDVDKTPWRSDR